MTENIPLEDLLRKARQTLAQEQLTLPLWAFARGLTPEQATHEIACSKGLVQLVKAVMAVGALPIAQEVPV